MYNRSFRSNRHQPIRPGGPRKRYSARFAPIGRASIPVHKFIRKAVPYREEEAYVPTLAFETLPVDRRLISTIVRHGYKAPTPIQDKAIPYVLEGKDVVGIANTGTGKTAAFLIPLIDKVLKNPNERVLIVSPTRELAMQTRDELRAFTQGTPVRIALAIGGAAMFQQMQDMRRRPQFIVGTPGRLLDFIERRALDLSTVRSVVLDEVDRMLDMGFIVPMKRIMALLPKTRQTLFFSATIPPEAETLMRMFLTNPVTVSVKKQDTAEFINQDIVKVPPGAYKIDVLVNLLKKEEFKKVLVFGRTKRGVERVTVNLYQKGYRVASIHGDKPQAKRAQAVRMFKENVVSILIATDVAARGLDIEGVTHVINYDQPATYEDYIHRIGRTGRANHVGQALTFVE